MVVYGTFKIGKTSMFAHWPRCGFIIDSQEQGIRYLFRQGLVPEPVFIWEIPNNPTGWEELLKMVIRAKGEPIDTLVTESFTGIEGVMFMHHAKEHFHTTDYPEGDISNADNSFYSYQKGPKQSAKFE